MENEAFWLALDALIAASEVIIDRPRVSKHPHYAYVYEVDYGYLNGTASMDGGGIDVWRGSKENQVCDAVICTIDSAKKDAEMKILLGCTEDEKDSILRFHNGSGAMKGILIRREK